MTADKWGVVQHSGKSHLFVEDVREQCAFLSAPSMCGGDGQYKLLEQSAVNGAPGECCATVKTQADETRKPRAAELVFGFRKSYGDRSIPTQLA